MAAINKEIRRIDENQPPSQWQWLYRQEQVEKKRFVERGYVVVEQIEQIPSTIPLHPYQAPRVIFLVGKGIEQLTVMSKLGSQAEKKLLRAIRDLYVDKLVAYSRNRHLFHGHRLKQGQELIVEQIDRSDKYLEIVLKADRSGLYKRTSPKKKWNKPKQTSPLPPPKVPKIPSGGESDTQPQSGNAGNSNHSVLPSNSGIVLAVFGKGLHRIVNDDWFNTMGNLGINWYLIEEEEEGVNTTKQKLSSEQKEYTKVRGYRDDSFKAVLMKSVYFYRIIDPQTWEQIDGIRWPLNHIFPVGNVVDASGQKSRSKMRKQAEDLLGR